MHRHHVVDDGTRLTLTVVLVVSHEEEVVVVTGEELHAVVLVERSDVLRDVHIITMEETGELLDKIAQQRIVVDGEFLQTADVKDHLGCCPLEYRRSARG